MALFVVTTHNQEGVQSQDDEHKPFTVEAETMLQAAESLGGEILTEANQFILVSKETKKKIMRFLVSPVHCKCKGR
ncbi:hypothetical protein NVP1257O_23 [Vibrio phage 1.257.O._10N.286.46.A4]|nr:hypothetical protein NVP1257O_23 [Vibrio phage 1.257.O._10N.286.46.A4]